MNAVGLGASAFIGVIVALVEFFSRYRAHPAAALRSLPGIAYLVLNAGASCAAFLASTIVGWRFGMADGEGSFNLTLARALVAGFGAMALLRSSLFTFSQGEAKIEAGPATLLNSLHEAVGRSLDQRHAEIIIRDSSHFFQGLEFDRDHEALTWLCSSALVNPDPESAKLLGTLAANLKASDIPGAVKLQIYAMRLVDLVGRGPLEAAASRMRQHHSIATSATLPESNAQEHDASAKRRAWQQVQAITALLALSDRSPFSVDLELTRACALWEIDPIWGAIAFSNVNHAVASVIFGAEVLVSSSRIHVLTRLSGVLAPKRGQKNRANPADAPSWACATAIYEMWRYLVDDEPSLAIDVLSASLGSADLWDVRCARAAVNLLQGRTEDATRDLDAALKGKAIAEPYLVPLVVSEEPFDPVLRPLRALLEPSLPDAARVPLWNAAVNGWTSIGDNLRRSKTTPERFKSLTTLGPDRAYATLMDVPALLRAVALRIPPRVPLSLRTHSFVRDTKDSALSPDLLARILEKVGSQILGADPTLPRLPTLDTVTSAPLEDLVGGATRLLAIEDRKRVEKTAARRHQELSEQRPGLV